MRVTRPPLAFFVIYLLGNFIMTMGILGQKIGMTRLFHADGKASAVTVIEVLPNRISQIKTTEHDGYSAVQVTCVDKKASKVNKPDAGHYAKAGVAAGRFRGEFRVAEEDLAQYQLGGEVKVDIFTVGQKVDVRGRTIGKGFAGTIKRHHFSGQRKTHGNSLSHRVPGAIGQNQSPGRVFKGKKMSGQMGAVMKSIANLEVMRVDTEKNLLLLKGAVPGSKGGCVIVRPSVKA